MQLFGHDILGIASRGFLAAAWTVGVVRIWRYRHLPQANQVLAAALAMVLSNSLLLLDSAPKDVLTFFNAMSQFILITAFAQVFKSLHDKTALHVETTKEHMVTLLGLGGAGVFGVFAQYLWMH